MKATVNGLRTGLTALLALGVSATAGSMTSAAEATRGAVATSQALLTIHYHRHEGDYDEVSLWTWGLQGAPTHELSPVGRDAFGVIFQLDPASYGKSVDRIGLLPRLHHDWQYKDGGDRFWSPDLGRDVYLVQGSSRVDRAAPDVRPHLSAATVDGERQVTARFTHRLPLAEGSKDRFTITTSTGSLLTLKDVQPIEPRDGRCGIYRIETLASLDLVQNSYVLHAHDMGEQPLRMGVSLLTSPRFCDLDAQLGATYTTAGTRFGLFAPTAAHVVVVTADTLEGPGDRHEMKRNDRGVWSTTVAGDLNGKYYAYKLKGLDLDPNVEVTDIYATCTQGRHARSLIVDLAKTDPAGFRMDTYRPPRSPADAVIYEMHVRDFTIAANSGVTAKGRYLGLAETGTHLPDDSTVTTGLAHLKELGITHVQLMPLQDFDNEEGPESGYQWGYMPVSFNSPDGWFASRTTGPSRIRELKTGIHALHEQGIGVILDVVYNHTASGASFEKLVPGYYFRINDSGQFWNGSGCGNEFASEHPMARKFILDSVKFWAEQYRVDGFRFDLMGLIDLQTMKEIRSELQKIRPGMLVYGEPWTAGESPLRPVTDRSQVRGTGIGAFNDHFRNAIKGEPDDDSKGFIQTGDRIEGVINGLQGAINDGSVDPVDSINYCECHDNRTTWDKLRLTVPKETTQVRERMMRFASLILLTSQGSVLLHSGQEFCRSKQGHANTYNLPDAVNQIDWSLKRAHRDVNAYTRGLIALRKAHPVLRLRTREQVTARITFPASPRERCVTYALDGSRLEGEPSQRMLVLLNGNSESVEFPLPAGRWSICVDADHAGTTTLGEASSRVSVMAHAGMVLTQ